MSQSPVPAVRVGPVAARTLVTELERHAGPKSGLIIGAAAGSEVLTAAVDALLPDDRLAVVAPAGGTAELREDLAGRGRWVAERVRVLESVGETDPVDVVVLAEPLTAPAEQVRAELAELAKLLGPGGVLSLASVVLPLPKRDLRSGDAATAVAGAGEAAGELERQAVLFGVGSDLVLRNSPPLRVHRLRFSPAEPATAGRLRPAFRPSSVRLTRDMHIDSNGVAAAGLALGAAALMKITRPRSRLWLLPALAAAPVAAFFRDPERTVPDDERSVVAASDGKVLSVERVTDSRFSEAQLLRIAVFLSVLDVHVNRAPVAGRVVDYLVTDGGYAAAMTVAAEHNVSAYTVLDTPRGTVVVAQRTGLLARRIVHRAPVGALLAKGERFGLIRFGSRTDVYLPAEAAEPLVTPGDRVYGGETVIARWTG